LFRAKWGQAPVIRDVRIFWNGKWLIKCDLNHVKLNILTRRSPAYVMPQPIIYSIASAMCVV